MNDGLKDKHREAIIRVLAENPRVERAVLFGSRAMGTHTPGSDVDLALYGEALTLDDQARLAAEIEELPVPQQVDLLRYRAIKNENLLRHIAEHGVQWYPRDDHGTPPPRTEPTERNSTPPSGGNWRGSGTGGEWRQTTLGAIATKDGYGLVDGPFGSNLPASGYTESGVPVIRGSNLTVGTRRFVAEEFVFVSPETANRLGRSKCRPLDIVFTKKGTLGQTGLVPKDGPYDEYLLLSNQMKLTLDSCQADPLYVYYFVSSAESTEKIIRDSEATGVPKTNVTYLRDYPIVLPSLPVQQRIANVLGSLDDKIELNRRMNETLEKMAAYSSVAKSVAAWDETMKEIPNLRHSLAIVGISWSRDALCASSNTTAWVNVSCTPRKNMFW